MLLRRWTTQEMIGLSRRLTDPTHRYGQTLMSIPETNGLRPRLVTAHEDLLASHGGTINARLAPIIEAQGGADFLHDGWLRVAYYTFEAQIHLAKTEGDATRTEQLTHIRNQLFPDGLKVVSYSYRDEVGQAEIVASRMTPDIQQVLASIPVADGRDLLQTIRAALSAAPSPGWGRRTVGVTPPTRWTGR